MQSLKTSDPLALRMLFSDELFLIDEPAAPASSAEALGSEVSVGLPQANVGKPVLAVKEPEVVPMPQTPVFNYLGENNKYFLLLVDQPGSAILNTKDLDSLTNILKAMKLEIRDVAILNLNKYAGTTFSMLKEFFVNTRLVLFGINPESLQLPALPANKITSFEGVKILPTFSFEAMNADPSLKRVFWSEMKVL